MTALAEELAKLRGLSQKNIVSKVKQLSEAGARATRAAMATTAAAAAIMIVLSLVITAGITRPLALMKKKMAEISSGVHDPGLRDHVAARDRGAGQDLQLHVRAAEGAGHDEIGLLRAHVP